MAEATVTRTDGQNAQLATHGCTAGAVHDVEVPEIDLLSPLELRGVRLRNRIVMSPMCQYSSHEGLANDWHLVHLGSRAAGGAALVFVEATAVTREGRISPGDMGIWTDQHVEPLARIAKFIDSQGAVAGIQLAHAGRKASCDVPWKGGKPLGPKEGGWAVIGPSAIPFSDASPMPTALDRPGIVNIVSAFEAAARRALTAGFKVIEIHSAHGYLLHEFLSPLANRRDDEYGGSLENRMRLLLRVLEGVRKIVPQELPVFVRISATDWVEGGWDIEQSVLLAKNLKELGVELIDVSSGGMVPTAQIPVAKGFQVPFARRIRDEAEIRTGAVGLICNAAQADGIITGGDADLVFIGREMLREPYWTLKAYHELGEEPPWPIPYGYAVKRRAK
ncbi:MAG TPA: NADH:flavin oxidoreductase/NADH oxidase [Lacipirellulaceae bacterium]|jgi:2,4-dienoyl-CoA reductase-like NADH-dependent reductase (Old Yellow Enzyme family)|nr:NADH:flavin oxidoreductase/NADH oxidase [Lacipirellulaceae bacterium]